MRLEASFVTLINTVDFVFTIVYFKLGVSLMLNLVQIEMLIVLSCLSNKDTRIVLNCFIIGIIVFVTSNNEVSSH